MVYGLRYNSEGQLGLGHDTPIHPPQPFISGQDFVLALNTDNNVIFSFGLNDEGQLGRN
ncbi:unnamed protein product [Oppiella nova]|uniref:Uncharacterized protein n=1 Tax=Oppiella nova TaxID=334625 RepID=A0A7R9QX08_9ACAR|nr:unnamed protein product [Oppiella nova]CAG2178711.1 unnamed protein product [Oppiella nova]